MEQPFTPGAISWTSSSAGAPKRTVTVRHPATIRLYGQV